MTFLETQSFANKDDTSKSIQVAEVPFCQKRTFRDHHTIPRFRLML